MFAAAATCKPVGGTSCPILYSCSILSARRLIADAQVISSLTRASYLPITPLSGILQRPNLVPPVLNTDAGSSATRMALRKGRGDERIAKLQDSPDMPESEATYKLAVGYVIVSGPSHPGLWTAAAYGQQIAS